MPFDDEKILQDYLTRLLQLQDERDEWLDADDLRAAARDLGLSDEDLARVEARVEAHRQRAARFAEHQAWDDALAEYRQATALAPFDAALLFETARLYAERFRQHADPADRAAAERFARRTIQLDPNHKASYELLSTLRAAPAPARRRPLVPLLIGGLMLGLLAALAFVVFFAIDAGPPPPRPAPAPIGQAVPPGGQQVLPVTLDADEAGGLILDVQRSLLRNFDSTFSYTLHAGLRLDKFELHQLRLRLDLLGTDGEVVLSKEFDALRETEPYRRPGDTVPIHHLVFERRPPPPVRAARLAVSVAEQQEAAPDYGAAVAVEPTWDVQKPAYFELDVTERENRLTEGLGGRRLHFFALAVRNAGRRALHRLRLKAVWRDAAGQAIHTKERYLVTTSMPALRPGETYVVRFIGEFAPGAGPPFAGYTLHVTSAD